MVATLLAAWPVCTAATFLDLSLRFLWTLSIMPSTINPFELLTQSELAGMCAAAAAPAPLPHLRRDWAHPCHICAGIGLASVRRVRSCAGTLRELCEYCTTGHSQG